MDGIRQELIELPAEQFTRPLCQVNARITRTGFGLELSRMNHQDLMLARFQVTYQLKQSRHHAVDLRQPCIGHQRNFHEATGVVMTDGD